MTFEEAELSAYTDNTPEVRIFQFELSEKWEFDPGQHTVLRFERDGEEVKRPYTPISLPGTKKFVLAVKEYEDGNASVWLHNREIGDKVEFERPEGNLSLRNYDEDIVLISTGTGATPMYAMLRDYLEKGAGSVHYIHGEKTRSHLLFKDSLELMEAENEDLEVSFLLTREEWEGKEGYIQEHLDNLIDSLEDKRFYICGVPAMVVSTQEKLLEMGVDDNKIVTEGWESDAA